MSFSALRQHWPAYILAFVVGATLVIPPVWNRIRYDIPFNSPANIRADDEALYFARIREVVDGHITIGNPYLFEHKSKPPAPIFLGEFLIALPLFVVGPQVIAQSVILDFFLPALAVLAVYCVLFRFSRSRAIATAATLIFFFGMFPVEFGRSVSPQLHMLVVLLALLALWEVARSSVPRLGAGIIAAISIGMLAYLYTYYAVFGFVFAVLLGSVFWLHGQWARARQFFIMRLQCL